MHRRSALLAAAGSTPRRLRNEITGRAELRDSTTRELLLLIEGDKAIGEKYREFTRDNNISNIQVMFTAFATRLRNSMDRVHGK